jgi:hypothetical protein
MRDSKLSLSSLVDAIKAQSEVAPTKNLDSAVVSVVSRPSDTIASAQKASGPPLAAFTGLSVGIAAAVLVWKHDAHRARIVNGCEWVLGRGRGSAGPSSATHEPTTAVDALPHEATHEATHEEDMTAPEAAPARSSAWLWMTSSVSARARVEPWSRSWRPSWVYYWARRAERDFTVDTGDLLQEAYENESFTVLVIVGSFATLVMGTFVKQLLWVRS